VEGVFGTDFAAVRVHTDSRAGALNRSLHSKEFAIGSDIFFREGTYNPRSVDGQRLLAHELAHIVLYTNLGAMDMYVGPLLQVVTATASAAAVPQVLE
jgi:hypothetical protein